MLIRCSSLHRLMTEPKLKADKEAGNLSATAISLVKEMVISDLFGVSFFGGNKYTEKGNEMEDEAIFLSGKIRNEFFIKNEERRSNDFLTGECDIHWNPTIDTKCSWSASTHPFLLDDAQKKVKESGYDWQGQGYMILYGSESHEVDFWLLPCPEHLIKPYDDVYELTQRIIDIPEQQRVTTVIVEKDKHAEERIMLKHEKALILYNQFKEEIMNKLEDRK